MIFTIDNDNDIRAHEVKAEEAAKLVADIIVVRSEKELGKAASEWLGAKRKAKSVFILTKRLPVASARPLPSSRNWVRHAKSGSGSARKSCPSRSTHWA